MLSAGAKLGPYEILGSLGAGGMGEVYRARDTRLDRTVAIKILPGSLAGDPYFRERFDREARVISSLEHPHICPVYDVGDEGGAAYLVMQHLEGQTLAERLARGPVPIEEAIRIGGQIAQALDCAHAAGIVHRDLKPANVFLSKTGSTGAPQVRLLDFGLAKATAVVSRGLATAMETTPAALTAQGTILGTFQYMAPEQIDGTEADARADIWAFGCVLYEMVAGRRPFEGQTQAHLIGAVMRAEPVPLSGARPGTPRALERLIAGCVAKNREERWQSIRDVARVLGGVEASETGAGQTAATGRGGRAWPRIVLWSAAGFALAIAAITGTALWSRSAGPASAIRFDVNPPPGGAIARFTDTHPYFAVSPDGARVAFVAQVPDGPRGIWIKATDRAAPALLEGTATAQSPFWSPDSRSIAYFDFAGGELKRKTIDGGPAQTVCAVVGGGDSGTWSRNGVILFAEWSTRRLLRVPENGGRAEVMRAGPAVSGWPQFLPDGVHFLFVSYDPAAATYEAFVGDLESDRTVPIPGISSKVEFGGGRLWFWRDGTLLAQPFDPSSNRLSGEARPVADSVHAFATTAFAAFSVGGSRMAVYQAGAVASRMVWIDRQGRETETIGPRADYTTLDLSPDGSAVAFGARDPILGSNDVWVHDLRRGITRRITTEKGTENRPIWSPDGRTVVYAADRAGAPHLFARNVDGDAPERAITPPSDAGPQAPGSFTPDGRSVVFSTPSRETGNDIAIVRADGSGPAVPLVRTKASEVGPRVSPNGRWLAYVSNDSGRSEVYVRSLDSEGRRWQISRSGGGSARWRRDGKELYYVESGRRVMVVDAAGDAFDAAAPRVLFTLAGAFTDYDVAADGQRFLFAFTDPIAETGTLSAILGWPALFTKD